MNHIPVKIWLHQFGIEASDEGPGDDEPDIWANYYRADGRELPPVVNLRGETTPRRAALPRWHI